MKDNITLALFMLFIVACVLLGWGWWYTGVTDCEKRGGVAVRSAANYKIVCIDKSALR